MSDVDGTIMVYRTPHCFMIPIICGTLSNWSDHRLLYCYNQSGTLLAVCCRYSNVADLLNYQLGINRLDFSSGWPVVV
jgi:hypothetical protein